MKIVAITENHLYQKVYARGRHVAAPTVVVYCLRDRAANRLQRENPRKQTVNRLGLTATKKLGNAVQRSRVRRILREAYRLADKEHPLRKGYLIVLVARPAAVHAKMQDVLRDLSSAFSKMDLYEAPAEAGTAFKEKPEECPL